MRRRPFEMREMLLVAFFAAFLVASRAALRWHLHIPGHAMLLAAFGLLLVRVCVDRRGAATLCGVLAGAAVAALGMGHGGPLIVLKLALPGLVVDLGAWVAGAAAAGLERLSIVGGAAIGAAAGLTAIVPMLVVEGLAGLEAEVIALHALTSSAGKMLFGAIGGAAAVWVARELSHHGLLVQPQSTPR